MLNPRGVKVKTWVVFWLSHGINWSAARVKFRTAKGCPGNLRKERERAGKKVLVGPWGVSCIIYIMILFKSSCISKCDNTSISRESRIMGAA